MDFHVKHPRCVENKLKYNIIYIYLLVCYGFGAYITNVHAVGRVLTVSYILG
jgi:hypothetical protein